jgi:cytochrome b
VSGTNLVRVGSRAHDGQLLRRVHRRTAHLGLHVVIALEVAAHRVPAEERLTDLGLKVIIRPEARMNGVSTQKRHGFIAPLCPNSFIAP